MLACWLRWTDILGLEPNQPSIAGRTPTAIFGQFNTIKIKRWRNPPFFCEMLGKTKKTTKFATTMVFISTIHFMLTAD